MESNGEGKYAQRHSEITSLKSSFLILPSPLFSPKEVQLPSRLRQLGVPK